MLHTEDQGPQCTACGSPLTLTAIESGGSGEDLRTFTCPKCKKVERHIIESLVTEAWLESRPAKKTRNAVTHDVRDGCMIPKPAK